jgi:hypothetical protein
VITANVRIQSPDAGFCQFSQMPPMPNWLAVLHDDRIGLLGTLAFDGFPFEKAIDRQDAVAPPIGVAKHLQLGDGLAFGVDRLTTAFRVLPSVRN